MFPLRRKKTKAMKKKIKIGLIGGGRIGKVHGENIQKYIPDAEVAILVNRTRREELIKWAEDLEIPRISSDPEDIFSDPDIDAVCICSATETHIDYIIRAAKAGKHIFCEKPVHWDISRIKEALEAVRKAGVKLQIGFVRRFDRSHRAVRETVSSGKLGAPYMIKACSRDPEPPSMEYIQGSGGIFLDMMIHDFDMARYLSGSEVTEVYAQGACLVDHRFADYGDVDTALVTLKFANGAMGVIDNCRRSSYGYDQRVEVHCEKGCVQDGNVLEHQAYISTDGGIQTAKPTWFFLERYNDAFVEEIKAFIAAVQKDQEVPVGGKDGLEPVRIALAAKKSLEERRPVQLSEIEA